MIESKQWVNDRERMSENNNGGCEGVGERERERSTKRGYGIGRWREIGNKRQANKQK